MLAKDALAQAQSVQNAEFWKERAKWLHAIAHAAQIGNISTSDRSMTDALREHLTDLGYVVKEHSYGYSCSYVSVSWENPCG